MDSKIFHGKNVIVQGISGKQGAFHTANMLASGTNVVAGTSPTKAGQVIDGVPVYATVEAIQADTQVDISVIFVPAPFAKAAMLEAINARVPLIICITEGVPVHDMLHVKQKAQEAGVVIIGPNCPGVSLPGVHKLGIIPANMTLPGTVAVVSRSGTLTYEAIAGLTERGIGQKYVIGIGGDRIRGTGFIECLDMFENDPDVTSIVMIGEIGGTDEHEAARVIQERISKPVFAYVAGHSAPPGVQLGHAGAILGGENESAAAKTVALSDAGARTFGSVIELVSAFD